METSGPVHAANSNSSKKIRFRKPFGEKYTLIISTNILAGTFPIETKAQIRWAFQVIDVDSKGQAEIELITIENKLLESNNPNLKDIAALSQAFGRMYSEIHVRIDANGKVVEILNLPLILDKWEQTKSEMRGIVEEVPAMQDIINLNDEIFASPDKVKLAIESNEFFNIYFHMIYGKSLPATDIKKTHRNLLNSIDVGWSFSAGVKHKLTPSGSVADVSIDGKPENTLDDAWIKEAYKAFEFIESSQIDPKLTEVAEYSFHEETGKLLEAVLIKKEIAHPDYIRGEMRYELKSEVGLKALAGNEEDGIQKPSDPNFPEQPKH